MLFTYPVGKREQLDALARACVVCLTVCLCVRSGAPAFVGQVRT